MAFAAVESEHATLMLGSDALSDMELSDMANAMA